MRYYPKLNLLFIHIPRTAGRAIKECMYDNLVHVYKEWERPHMRLPEVIHDLPEDVKMFTVYRNERDRLLSYYRADDGLKKYIDPTLTFSDYVPFDLMDRVTIVRYNNLVDDLNQIGRLYKIDFNKIERIGRTE